MAAVVLPAPVPGRRRARPAQIGSPSCLRSTTSSSSPAFALIRFQGADHVTLLGGERVDHELLGDVPLESGAAGRRAAGSTDCSACRTPRSASVASRRTKTARRCRASRSRSRSRSPTAELLAELPDEPIDTVGERRLRHRRRRLRRDRRPHHPTTRSATARAPTSSSAATSSATSPTGTPTRR